MPESLIRIDLSSAPETQDVLHNRWHPDIPMVATVKPGAEFRVECVDWTGGQISNDESANDVRDVNLTKVHYLSGPIGVDGAEPGDLLVVDILDVGVLPESDWGFTGGPSDISRDSDRHVDPNRPLTQVALCLSRPTALRAEHWWREELLRYLQLEIAVALAGDMRLTDA